MGWAQAVGRSVIGLTREISSSGWIIFDPEPTASIFVFFAFWLRSLWSSELFLVTASPYWLSELAPDGNKGFIGGCGDGCWVVCEFCAGSGGGGMLMRLCGCELGFGSMCGGGGPDVEPIGPPIIIGFQKGIMFIIPIGGGGIIKCDGGAGGICGRGPWIVPGGNTLFNGDDVSFSSSASPRPFCFSCSIKSSSGILSIPHISRVMSSRPFSALGTLSMFSLWTCMQWICRPGPVNNFLWHTWHLKCFAFWCCSRIFSSSNSLLQYVNKTKDQKKNVKEICEFCFILFRSLKLKNYRSWFLRLNGSKDEFWSRLPSHVRDMQLPRQ